jgi:excisionase family DNA binding protein
MTTQSSITLPKLAYSIPEFHAIGGPGRSVTYELIKSGELNAIKVGGSTKILASEVERFFATRPSAQRVRRAA